MKKNGMSPEMLKVVDKDFRNYYRQKTANNIPKRLHEYTNDKIIRLFLKKVAEEIVRNRAGVHIDKIGYFYNHMIPFKFTPSFTRKINLKKYYTTFIPTHDSLFKYWLMDFKFNHNIVKNMNERVDKGVKYLNMINGVSEEDYFYQGVNKSALYKLKKQNNVI